MTPQEQREQCYKEGLIGYGNRDESFCHAENSPGWCIADGGYTNPEKCPRLYPKLNVPSDTAYKITESQLQYMFSNIHVSNEKRRQERDKIFDDIRTNKVV